MIEFYTFSIYKDISEDAKDNRDFIQFDTFLKYSIQFAEKNKSKEFIIMFPFKVVCDTKFNKYLDGLSFHQNMMLIFFENTGPSVYARGSKKLKRTPLYYDENSPISSFFEFLALYILLELDTFQDFCSIVDDFLINTGMSKIGFLSLVNLQKEKEKFDEKKQAEKMKMKEEEEKKLKEEKEEKERKRKEEEEKKNRNRNQNT